MDLWVVFLTGLTVGGLTCLAVQGGLLASTIAARTGEDLSNGEKTKAAFPILVFLIAKFIGYTVLGFILGLLGKTLIVSDGVRVFMQLLAGIYMVLIALNLLNVHPIFRYAVLTPPRFFTRMVRNQSKSKDLFAPAILGAMTIFIPCGTTLAMEALAISTGNPLWGAAIMGVFVLGTSPLFFGLGYLTHSLGGAFKKNFLRIAAIAVLYLGITSIDGSLVLLNSPVTLGKLAQYSPIQINWNPQENARPAQLVDGVQVFDINVTSRGYSPNYLEVAKGIPVKLNLKTSGAYTCAAAFRIPELGIAKNLKPTGVDFVEFTPERSGQITFACSMGMYSGVINVI